MNPNELKQACGAARFGPCIVVDSEGVTHVAIPKNNAEAIRTVRQLKTELAVLKSQEKQAHEDKGTLNALLSGMGISVGDALGCGFISNRIRKLRLMIRTMQADCVKSPNSMPEGSDRDDLKSRIGYLQSILNLKEEAFTGWFCSLLGTAGQVTTDPAIQAQVEITRACLKLDLLAIPYLLKATESSIYETSAKLKKALEELGVEQDDPILDSEPVMLIPVDVVKKLVEIGMTSLDKVEGLEKLVGFMAEHNIGFDGVVLVMQHTSSSLDYLPGERKDL